MSKQSGKPRGDVTDCDMRTSRLRFKYALRQCQSNGEIMRADALARSLYCKDSVSFWKGVSGMNSSKVPLVTKVSDSVGSKNRCGRITFPLYSIVFKIFTRKSMYVNALNMELLIMKVLLFRPLTFLTV